MIRADLERLVPPHDEPSLLVLLVLQKPDITSSTLLPVPGFTVELEEFGAHLKGLLFKFLVGLGLDFLGQVDDGLEVDVRGFIDFFLKDGNTYQ